MFGGSIKSNNVHSGMLNLLDSGLKFLLGAHGHSERCHIEGSSRPACSSSLSGYLALVSTPSSPSDDTESNCHRCPPQGKMEIGIHNEPHQPARVLLRVDRDHLVCQLSDELLRAPVTLVCGHSFSKTVLKQRIRKGWDELLRCPRVRAYLGKDADRFICARTDA